MRNEFTAIYELDDSGAEPRYVAYCVEISGARADGKTMDDARAGLAEAIKSALEQRRAKSLRSLSCEILSLPHTSETIAVQETIALQWVPALISE